MLKKMRYFGVFLVSGLFILSCQAYGLPVSLAQETATPTPKVKTLVSLEAQAGNTDVIVIVGILIFAFIVIPILLSYKEWRAS
jgi:hypothetical protein